MSRRAKIFSTDSVLAQMLVLKGITTVTELARLCEMESPRINNVVNGKAEFIFGAEPGSYRQDARRIAEVLEMPPEVLFGEDPRADERRQLAEQAFVEMNPRAVPDPEMAVVVSNLRETTIRILATLTPREERVLKMRFGIGLDTKGALEDIGDQFSITRERIRQIEARALRKLKSPRSTRSLLDT